MYMIVLVFFFNDTATTEIYTLSLHDALPIWVQRGVHRGVDGGHVGEGLDVQLGTGVAAHRDHAGPGGDVLVGQVLPDRKSTRLNSSHANISYAVFCLKKKKTIRKSKRMVYVQ